MNMDHIFILNVKIVIFTDNCNDNMYIFYTFTNLNFDSKEGYFWWGILKNRGLVFLGGKSNYGSSRKYNFYVKNTFFSDFDKNHRTAQSLQNRG